MALGGAVLLNQSVQDGPLNSYTMVIANLSRLMVEVTGVDIIQNERVLASPITGFAMRVDNDCNGMWAHLILLASILAYPATWKERAIGIVAGQAILYFINIFRVASLFFIGVYSPSIFRAAHIYVWQFLIIGFALVLLFVWVERFVHERPA